MISKLAAQYKKITGQKTSFYTTININSKELTFLNTYFC